MNILLEKYRQAARSINLREHTGPDAICIGELFLLAFALGSGLLGRGTVLRTGLLTVGNA
jgi:hypothetical protein